MDRRQFISGAASVVVSSTPHQNAGPSEVKLRLVPTDKTWTTMPADYIGLSYEMGQLYNARFFSPANLPLVRAFRALNTTGVLRLGGHLSNITGWEGTGRDDPRQVRGVRHGIEDYWEWPLVDPAVQQNKRGLITKKALVNLRSFLDQVNWRLMYGLNFACGSPQRAADEAAAVADILGDRLIAFVIGNEPDGFSDDPFFRPKQYGFEQYIVEYGEWAKTIRQKVPRAQFAGPDTDGKVDTWVLEYARHTQGDAILLTSHYYGMGPANDPSMTAERLLQKANVDLEAQIDAVTTARQAAGGTPYRMDEGNSCFGGGRKGVSDAYAAALWAADYILRTACAGFAGVNLHGGGAGVYTPIESSAEAPALPRPVYYGMLFAQMFAGLPITQCGLNTGANIAAYQGGSWNSRSGKALLAFVNKGESTVSVTLPDQFATAKHIQRWELGGPSLSAKNGIRLGRIPASRHAAVVEVAGYSGTIVRSE